MFAALLSQTCTIEPFVAESTSGWGGAESYGTAVTYSCRVEMKQKNVVARDGRELVADGKVILAGIVTTFDDRARITLPSGYSPAQPHIYAIEQQPDPFGIVACTVIWFGKVR